MGRLKKIIAARRRLFLCFGIAGRRDIFPNSLRSMAAHPLCGSREKSWLARRAQALRAIPKL